MPLDLPKNPPQIDYLVVAEYDRQATSLQRHDAYIGSGLAKGFELISSYAAHIGAIPLISGEVTKPSDNVFAVIRVHQGKSLSDLRKWILRDPEVRSGHIHDPRVEVFRPPPPPILYNMAPRRGSPAPSSDNSPEAQPSRSSE